MYGKLISNFSSVSVFSFISRLWTSVQSHRFSCQQTNSVDLHLCLNFDLYFNIELVICSVYCLIVFIVVIDWLSYSLHTQYLLWNCLGKRANKGLLYFTAHINCNYTIITLTEMRELSSTFLVLCLDGRVLPPQKITPLTLTVDENREQWHDIIDLMNNSLHNQYNKPQQSYVVEAYVFRSLMVCDIMI